MERAAALGAVIALLEEQQSIASEPSEKVRLCADFGVCGGDLQEFLSEHWTRSGLPLPASVKLYRSEKQLTVGDVLDALLAPDQSD